jgi:hypothetical protein
VDELAIFVKIIDEGSPPLVPLARRTSPRE